MRKERGVTLVELMVVVAIIGVLTAIAFPAYLQYMRRTADGACLAEVKGYTMTVFAALAADDVIPSPTHSACKWITDASTIVNLDISMTLDAYPVDPGSTGSRCNLTANTACVLEAAVVDP